MRKCLIISLLVCLAATAVAQQMSVFSFGVRGGIATHRNFASDAPYGKIGGTGCFDFGYHIYDHVDFDTELGFRTGINVGYAGTGYTRDIKESFRNFDYENSPMDYRITASACEQRIQQVHLELPVMFALRYKKGFVMDVGMKVQAPVWSQSRQDIEDLMIEAYYPETKVPIVNELITGKATQEQLHRNGSANLSAVSLLASLEIGYEWNFGERNTNVFGIKAYFDMGVWSAPMSATGAGYTCSLPGSVFAPREGRVVDVAPILDAANPVPAVAIRDVYAPTKTHYISLGVKLYYAIEVHHRSSYGLHARYLR